MRWRHAAFAFFMSTAAAAAQPLPFDMSPEAPAPTAPAKPADPSGPTTGSQAVLPGAENQRRYLIPFGELVLAGETARRSWAVYLTPQEAESPASMQVAFQNAIVVAPEASRLKLWINGTRLIDTPVSSPNSVAQLDAALPAGVLRPGFNEIVVEASLRHRTDCTIQSTYELWTQFDPTRTFLTFQGTGAGRWKSFEDIRAIGVDERGETSFNFVVPSLTQAVATAPVVRLAEALAILANMPNQAFDLRETLGRPAGPGQATVIVGPAAEIQHMVPNLPAGASTTPVSAMVEEPGRAFSTFVITGPNWQAVNSAIDELIKQVDRPAESRRTSLATQTWRMPDVPIFFDAGRKRFSELGVPTQEFSGRRFKTDFSVGVPSDFYADSYGHITLLLDAAYSEQVLPGSHIDVYVNDNIAATIPITAARGEILRHLPVNVTMRHFRPGDNKISIEADLRTQADSVCAPGATASTSSRFVLFDSSEMVMPAFARIGRTPNLAAIAGTGAPYSRSAGPVALVVDNAQPQVLSAAVSLMARLSAAAGRPIPIDVTAVPAAITDRDAVFVGAASQIPAAVLSQVGIADDSRTAWGEAVSSARSDTDVTFDQWRDKLRGSGWRGQVSALEDWLSRTFNLSGSSLRLIPRTDAPYSPAGNSTLLVAQQSSPGGSGTWTLVTAPDANKLRSGMDMLTNQAVWRQLGGRITTIDAKDAKVTVQAAARTAFVETLPFSISNYRLIIANWLSANALFYALVLALLSIVLGLATAGLLSSTGRRS